MTLLPIIQPVAGDVRSAIEQLATATSGGTCRICSAWMTPDGLSLANDLLVRNDVNLKEILVGINRGGTSARALRVALAILAQTDGTLKYYLDGKLAGPIFHPKVWFMESASFRGAYVGSANLTREGLLNNVEAGIVLTDGGVSYRNEASSALDELERQLNVLSRGPYATVVSEASIARLVEIGAVPERSVDSRRDDADEGVEVTASADALLGVSNPRTRSAFRPVIVSPMIAVERRAPTRSGSRPVVVTVPIGASLRYVRFYGLSEANRVRKILDGIPASGTLESNISMENDDERRFWEFPERFAVNASGAAREWRPRVRLITTRDGRTLVTVIPDARLWTRIRDGQETEVRFRFVNAATVRGVFPTDVDERTLLAVDRSDDDEADYEVRLVSPNDPDYDGLRPTGGVPYEYRIV